MVLLTSFSSTELFGFECDGCSGSGAWGGGWGVEGSWLGCGFGQASRVFWHLGGVIAIAAPRPLGRLTSTCYMGVNTSKQHDPRMKLSSQLINSLTSQEGVEGSWLGCGFGQASRVFWCLGGVIAIAAPRPLGRLGAALVTWALIPANSMTLE